MPTIVNAATLRGVLGVSSALYSDAVLDDIIDTAETVILPMLVTFKAPVEKVKLYSNVATYTTVGEHEFTQGQSVIITGCGSPFNGTFTVLPDDLTDYTFTLAITNADIIEKNVIPSGVATLSGASTYVGNSAVETAVLAVSVEVFQSRVSAGGQIEGVDFTVSPYRLGRSLFNRVSGVLGSYIDEGSMIG
jgi:hypothetical protein